MFVFLGRRKTLLLSLPEKNNRTVCNLFEKLCDLTMERYEFHLSQMSSVCTEDLILFVQMPLNRQLCAL